VAALVVAVCFAAGLNVYATVATLGLLARAHIIALPLPLGGVTSWWVIAASVAIYLVEFVADKIPGVDLIWNALQTFVRVPAASVLGYLAAAHLSPLEQAAAALLGGCVALIAHGGKTAARMAVTPSPEPVSNIVLSLGEDAVAVLIVSLAGQHPYWAAGIATALLAIIVILARTLLRAIGAAVRAALPRSSGADPSPSTAMPPDRRSR